MSKERGGLRPEIFRIDDLLTFDRRAARAEAESRLRGELDELLGAEFLELNVSVFVRDFAQEALPCEKGFEKMGAAVLKLFSRERPVRPLLAIFAYNRRYFHYYGFCDALTVRWRKEQGVRGSPFVCYVPLSTVNRDVFAFRECFRPGFGRLDLSHDALHPSVGDAGDEAFARENTPPCASDSSGSETGSSASDLEEDESRNNKLVKDASVAKGELELDDTSDFRRSRRTLAPKFVSTPREESDKEEEDEEEEEEEEIVPGLPEWVIFVLTTVPRGYASRVELKRQCQLRMKFLVELVETGECDVRWCDAETESSSLDGCAMLTCLDAAMDLLEENDPENNDTRGSDLFKRYIAAELSLVEAYGRRIDAPAEKVRELRDATARNIALFLRWRRGREKDRTLTFLHSDLRRFWKDLCDVYPND